MKGGFPPYHPLVGEQAWDMDLIAIDIRNDPVGLVKSGYNVHGTQIPINPNWHPRASHCSLIFDSGLGRS
ncbi:hypothetical protein F5Y03DRAFT_353004 [Xylaria venustula]|nr:hypothetical protein F5Y03DRAFT_353004 [Xylaria venustula]